MNIVHEKLTTPTCNSIHLSVHVVNDATKTHLYCHPGHLTVCKKKLEVGGTGELVKKFPYTLSYTRLGPQNCMIRLEHSDHGVVHSEMLRNHHITVIETNPSFKVTGFDDLTSGIFLREFFIPSISFPSTPMPSFMDTEKTNMIIKSMELNVPESIVKKNIALKKLVDNNIVWKKRGDADPRKNNTSQNERSLLNMKTAKRMLYFNSNAISRIRSMFPHMPLNFARNICLTVALAHNGQHVQEGMLIAHTLQYASISTAAGAALEALRDTKPTSKISYLAAPDRGSKSAPYMESDHFTKKAMYMYALGPGEIEQLSKHGVCVRKGLGCVVFAERDARPILIANTETTALERTCIENKTNVRPSNQWLCYRNYMNSRLWMHAAATRHREIAHALPHLLKATSVHANEHSAFELWDADEKNVLD
jgi:hypothetical protein